MHEIERRTCPQCGSVVPQDAPSGLCPTCVMAMNLSLETKRVGATGAMPRSPKEIQERPPRYDIMQCLGRGGKLRRIKLTICVFLFALACLPHLTEDTTAGAEIEQRLRIGVYDSRAIVIAYTSSAYNDHVMQKKSKQKKKAEQAGDTHEANKIEAWMTHISNKKHSQAFGTAPVHDLLHPIKMRLPQIAKEAGVDAIISKWEFDYVSPDAEVRDVTMLLVKAYEPKPELIA